MSHQIQLYGQAGAGVLPIKKGGQRFSFSPEVQRPSVTLTTRQLCDIELILNGGFSPLSSFLSKNDYESVIDNMHLANGIMWPIPIMLDVTEVFLKKIKDHTEIVLRDREGMAVAILEMEESWSPDKNKEAKAIYGTKELSHPGVAYLMHETHDFYLSGKLTEIRAPQHYDFLSLRLSPQECRDQFEKQGWEKIIAFQTRNPMHRVHQVLTERAARKVEANLLIHPVTGSTQPGDIDYYTRVRCYEKLLSYYPERTTMLSLLPLSMRMAGPKEALWHSIVRQNYGCTHFIVGRDHAGPTANGKQFYHPDAAVKFVERYQDDLDIQMVTFPELVYVPESADYLPANKINPKKTVRISGRELRERLRADIAIPKWFSFPEVINELKKTYPPRYKQGFTLFLTGLSAAGKTALAQGLQIALREIGGRQVSILDGDMVRRDLSIELGFSKQDRESNVERVGYVASQITKHGGIAICALIAPFLSTRQKVADRIRHEGGFLEIYLSTPLEVCESRDKKGYYAKARAGKIKDFTGIDSPYEKPENAELECDMSKLSVDEAVQQIILKLEKLGFIKYEQ